MSTTSSFYSDAELVGMGFGHLGKGCKISRFARFYGIGNISIGNNVRIDDFCILSGHITIGSNIHISAFVALYGAKGIVIEDYSGVSPHSTIYSAMDDFSGNYLVGPIHPEEFTNVTGGTVTLKRCVQIGCNSVVFPNVTIGEGSIVGAYTLVRYSLEPWCMYVGIPARKLKERSKEMLKFIGNEHD